MEFSAVEIYVHVVRGEGDKKGQRESGISETSGEVVQKNRRHTAIQSSHQLIYKPVVTRGMPVQIRTSWHHPATWRVRERTRCPVREAECNVRC